MSKQTEALKLALGALENRNGHWGSSSRELKERAITALREALAEESSGTEQPAQQCWKCGDMDSAFQAKCSVPACGMKEQPAQQEQEPVAWAESDENGNICWDGDECFADDHAWLERPIPLYTSPPAQRKPLTEEEIIKCWGQASGTRHGYVAFARAIEAAHGIKGDA